MLKLWGRINSINVQKVLWALEELKVPYERTDAGLQFGVVNELFYRKMNPNGRVPTIEDDGLVLWESNAIVRYLSAKHGAGTLWPDDPRQRADADRWMDWATSTVAPAITPVFWGLIRTPPEKRALKAIDEGAKKLADAFQVLEQSLEGRDHVAGKSFTMGDIPLGTFVYRWYALEVKRPRLA
ncbi:MAG TPA: glutathione S-transferase family protein, partial [Burkholderiales bacterium]|nr:glutathione S-transferase family protein [Burkholderiales bacterium]